jgi:hypothetical protein
MTNRLWEHLDPRTANCFSIRSFYYRIETCCGSESNSCALAPVKTFFADYNKHDLQAASVLFDQELAVTEALPPFHFRGKHAFTEWMADLDSYNTSDKYTDYEVQGW